MNEKMKKALVLMSLLALAVLSVNAQKKLAAYAVGFYNQENLFDTEHDEGKLDTEFLPGGSYRWTEMKYKSKLHNMAQALADMGTDKLPGVGCAFIGLSEVENEHVMRDLVAQPELAARGYKYLHVEGPDLRGIDCAAIYNPQLFEVRNVKLVPYVQRMKDNPNFKTRGFLTISGTMAGEHVTCIVCHLPSRFNGSEYREQGAEEIKALKDSLLKEDPNVKVLVMGDMNDDPTSPSMSKVLRAKANKDDVGKDDMFNPWYNILAKEGKGTLMYRGAWNLFDQIILSSNLIDKGKQRDYSTLKFWKNEIQRMPYLFQTEGQYKGSPKRTTAGGVWLNGYSDHLPVVVLLVKAKQ